MPQEDKEKRPKDRRRLVWLFPLGVLAAVAVYALVNIFIITNQRAEARNEYGGLLDSFGPAETAQDDAPETDKGIDHAALLAINPDYVGWLTIPGTDISYPVVQGADNDKYLNATFEGRYNPAGSIFMDYANKEGFASRHTILYGHNMKDSTMFGGLAHYHDVDYLAEHSTIEITLPDETVLTYRIFAARTTSADDMAYRVAFASEDDFGAFAVALGASRDAVSLLTLSTCTNSENDLERLLIHAVLVE